MNTKNQFYEAEYPANHKAAIKTMSLQVVVTEPDLKHAVREAFDLAKSAGRELDLAFTLQPLAQDISKRSDTGAAQHALP